MIYTIYNTQTGEVVSGLQELPEDFILPENQAYTTLSYTENFAAPYFDGQKYYNGATLQEQSAYEREQRRISFFQKTEDTNLAFTTPQTSESLNDYYPEVGTGFTAICPNVQDGADTGIIYRKTTETTWRKAGVINSI